MSSYLPNNYHGLVVRCTAMGWFLVFIEIHARPTFQNVQMSHHNLSFSSKDCELDSDPLVLNKPWCDVNFRSQIVYMIFTGLKPRLCNMFIIHIYIYFFQLGRMKVYVHIILGRVLSPQTSILENFSALESVMKFALSEPHWLIDPYRHRRQTLEVLNIWESWNSHNI